MSARRGASRIRWDIPDFRHSIRGDVRQSGDWVGCPSYTYVNFGHGHPVAKSTPAPTDPYVDCEKASLLQGRPASVARPPRWRCCCPCVDLAFLGGVMWCGVKLAVYTILIVLVLRGLFVETCPCYRV